MKINKRIEELEERIEKLERENRILVVPANAFWTLTLPGVSLKVVVNKIMDYLDLKISYNEAQGETFTLEKRQAQKGKK